MKKKFVIASLIIIAIFIIFVVASLLLSEKPTSSPSPSPAQNEQQTQDDLNFGQTIDELHQQYPWYSQIPIVTDDYTIAFNFDKNSFRIILLKPATEAIKQSALNALQAIGVDLDKFNYYFIESKSGSSFQQLLQ